MSLPPADPPIRPAATLILLRDTGQGPAVLMGQRGAGAIFMPGKFVFPGGGVDSSDADVPVRPMGASHATMMAEHSAVAPDTLAAAAIRELWEETGLILGYPAPWPDPPKGWRQFAATGHKPDASALRYVFRAITPPGRPRRYDARFFLANAARLRNAPDDLCPRDAELAHLQWVPLQRTGQFDLPGVTQRVIAALAAHLARGGPIRQVPFLTGADQNASD